MVSRRSSAAATSAGGPSAASHPELQLRQAGAFGQTAERKRECRQGARRCHGDNRVRGQFVDIGREDFVDYQGGILGGGAVGEVGQFVRL